MVQGKCANSSPKDELHSIFPYEAVQKIDSSPLGDVWKLYHPVQKKHYALKRRFLATSVSDECLARFRFEATLLKEGSHPALAAAHDFIFKPEEGWIGFTQCWIEGSRLDAYFEHHGPQAAEALWQHAIEAINTLHHRGYIHGDLKPPHLLVRQDDSNYPQLALIDLDYAFGWTQEAHATPRGTPAYWSSEQAEGYTLDPADDYYALALSFYQALTSVPLAGSNPKKLRALGLLCPQLSPRFTQTIDALLRSHRGERQQVWFAQDFFLSQTAESRILWPRQALGQESLEAELEALLKTKQQRAVLWIQGAKGSGKSFWAAHIRFVLTQKQLRVSTDPLCPAKGSDVWILDQADWKLPETPVSLILCLTTENIPIEQEMRILKAGYSLCRSSLKPWSAEVIDSFFKSLLQPQSLPERFLYEIKELSAGNPERIKQIWDSTRKALGLFKPSQGWLLAPLIETQSLLTQVRTGRARRKQANSFSLWNSFLTEDLRAGRWPEAEAMLAQWEHHQAQNKPAPLAKILWHEKKAWLALARHQLEDAAQHLQAASAVLDCTSEAPLLTQCRLHNFWGQWCLKKSDWTTAQTHFLRSRDLWQQLSDMDKKEALGQDLGFALWKRGQRDKAIAEWTYWESQLQALGAATELRRFYYITAECYAEESTSDLAISYYEKGIALCQKDHDWTLLFRFYNGLANWYQQRKQYDTAHQFYARAFDLSCYQEDWLQASSIRLNQANLMKKIGNLEEALLFLHKTQTLLERQRQDSTQLRRVRVLVYLQKTEIFLELNEIAQAAHALTQAEALLLQSEESSDLQPVLAKLRLSLAEAEGHPQKIEDALVQFTHLSKVAPTTDTHRAERQLVNREQETPMNQATQVISSSDPSSSELKQILEMNKILSLARSNEELIQSMLSQATLLSGAEASALFLAGSGPLTLAATFPAQSASIFSLQTAQECLSTKEALRVADAQNDERTQRFESVQKMGLKSLLYLPLISPRQTWGVLAVSHHTGVHRFNQTLEYQMRLFADQAVLVWERLQQEINLETHLRATQKALEQSEKEAEAYESLWRQNRGQTRLDQLVGQSACMQALKEKVHRLADTPLSITLQGPSGSGKELVARSLHELSSRKKNPFIAINCGALPAHLIESELFGHRAGSFTGAHRDKKGLFELAQGGTLFLDEIGDLETSLQVKLLRALQEREIRRVGDEKCIPIDIRVIAATCRNLEHEMNQGRFRDDLYYRIAEVRLDLPSLAERREDIPDLVHFFISDFFGKKKKPVLERALLERWMQHRWPGNVRQLASQVRVACALSDGTKLRLQDWLLTQTHSAPQPAVASPSPIALPPKAVNTVQEEPTATEWLNALIDAPMNWEEIESRVFSAVFQQTDQDLKKAAHRLKISSSTLYGWQRKSKKRKTDSKPETAPKLSLRLDDIKTYCIQRVQKQTEDAYRTANQLGLSPATVYKWLKESPKVRAN